MKLCTKCGEIKNIITDFYMKNKQKVELGYMSECKECMSKRNNKYQKENPEKRNELVKRFYKTSKGKEQHRNHSKKQRENGIVLEWQRNNKDKILKYTKKRKIDKTHNITKQEWEDCLIYFSYSCAYCGINQSDAKIKYNNNLHKEHVEHKGANDISNCVPSCKGCNSSKGTFEFKDWYTKNNPVYLEERLNKILLWLSKVNNNLKNNSLQYKIKTKLR